jgi:hypothetical protein
MCHLRHINKEFHLIVSEFFFTLLFVSLRFFEKKLEAVDAIDNRCCTLIIN